MELRIGQTADGEWYLKIMASDGEPLAYGEGSKRLADARHAAESIQQQSAKAQIVLEHETASDDRTESDPGTPRPTNPWERRLREHF